MSTQGVTIPSNLDNDIKQIEKAQEMVNFYRQKILALAAALKHMKNPMEGIIEIMGALQDVQGSQLQGLSASQNLATDVGQMFTTAQSEFNSAFSNKGASGFMVKFLKSINNLQNFCDWEKAHGYQGMSPTTVANLESAIGSVKGPFGSSWGNYGAMQNDLNTWINDSNSGQFAPQIRTIQNGLQTSNQTLTGVQTALNTKVGFAVQEFDSYLGEMQSTIKSFQTLVLAMIQKNSR